MLEDMISEVAVVAADLRDAVRELEPERLDGRDAARLVKTYAEIERLAVAGLTLAARRVEGTGVWAHEGDRTFASWLARVSGTGLGEAVATAETVEQLTELPTTEAAMREGHLSRTQAHEVASAATADPDSEELLLATAGSRTVAGLKEQARQVKAAACLDPDERHQRIRKNRHIRHWNDDKGAHLHLQSTPEDIGIVLTGIEAYLPSVRAHAQARGSGDTMGAHCADALVAMARDALADARPDPRDGRPRAELRIRVDFAALESGTLERGQVCEVPGLGRVPVKLVRSMLPNALVDLIITKGKDVRAVVTHSRYVREAVRIALEERYPTCAKWDCDQHSDLENDHLDDYAKFKYTKYARLVPWCRYHHYLKTYRGYTPVQLGDGEWDLKPPDAEPPDDRGPPALE